MTWHNNKVLTVSIPEMAVTEQTIVAMVGPHRRIVWANKTREWQKRVRRAFEEALDDNTEWFIKEGEAVVIKLTVYVELSGRAARERRKYPTVKPDVDKLGRPVLDAFVKAYKSKRMVVKFDDTDVIDLLTRKRYAADARTTVEVHRISNRD